MQNLLHVLKTDFTEKMSLPINKRGSMVDCSFKDTDHLIKELDSLEFSFDEIIIQKTRQLLSLHEKTGLMESIHALSNDEHHNNQKNCARCDKCDQCQKNNKEKHRKKCREKNCKGNCSFKKKKCLNPLCHVNNKSHCVCRICADSRLRFSDTSTCDTTCIQVAFHNNAGIENLEEDSEFHDILSHFFSEDILHLRFGGIGGHVPLFPCHSERHKSILKCPLKRNSFLFLQISKDCCLPNKPFCVSVSFSFLFIFPNSLITLNKPCHLRTKYMSQVEDNSNKRNLLPDSLVYNLRNEEVSAFVKKFFKQYRLGEAKSIEANETKAEIFGVKKNEKGENYKSFDERVIENVYEILSHVEIRHDEIVAYPATQQPVLEPILNKFSVPERAPSKHDTMAVEFLRLCTMHDYPNTNGPSLLRLAQAGFFYEGNGNELVCFSCDFRKGSWNYNDSPREIHLRMSPNCKFLSQGGDGNVPVPREESTQDLVPLQSAPQVGVVEPDGPRTGYNASTSNNTAHLASANYSDGQDQPDSRRTMVVKHPEYASRPARLASYANFPRHMKQHPADMTDAGFYYAGFGDCCRCFHCGIGLRNWDPEDNPWIEHARWSMECPYILKIKGQAFIDLVQEAARAAEMAQDDEDSEAEGESAANNSDSGNQEKSGASNSSPSGGPAANEIENNVAKTSEATMSKGSSDDSGFGSGSAPVAQPIKAPLRTAAAQSLIHDEKIKPKYVTAAIEDLVKAEGWGAFTKENIRKYLKIHEENRKSASSASNADPNMLKQENKELKDLTICKICLDEKVSIVFLPCGHLVSCPQCAPALTKCPICRKNIKGTVRTNLVEKSTAK